MAAFKLDSIGASAARFAVYTLASAARFAVYTLASASRFAVHTLASAARFAIYRLASAARFAVYRLSNSDCSLSMFTVIYTELSATCIGTDIGVYTAPATGMETGIGELPASISWLTV